MALTVNIRKQLPHFELRTDFSCQGGQLTALVGPSGAGKTSLVRLIAGLETLDDGTISLNGHTWADSESGLYVPTRHRNIGLVFQEYVLFPHMTIRQNIEFGAPDGAHGDRLMDLFGIRHLCDQRPCSISGGERQRAAFCQALAREPALLLLDEPFSALDVETRSFLCDLLLDIKNDLGIPILHVTHDLGEAKRLSDSIIAVEEGRIAPDWFARQQNLHFLNNPISSPSYS